jgi:hypothetical protein
LNWWLKSFLLLLDISGGSQIDFRWVDAKAMRNG